MFYPHITAESIWPNSLIVSWSKLGLIAPSIFVMMDETVEIAQWYCRSNSSIHLIQDSIGNLGCPNSFYEIIKRVPEYDYYAFADQDDIWKTDKIERAVRAIENSGDKVPTVYFSSFSYVNEDGETMRESAPPGQVPLFS